MGIKPNGAPLGSLLAITRAYDYTVKQIEYSKSQIEHATERAQAKGGRVPTKDEFN